MDEARLREITPEKLDDIADRFKKAIDAPDDDPMCAWGIDFGEELIAALRAAWRERDEAMAKEIHWVTLFQRERNEATDRAERAEAERDIASERAHVARTDLERTEHDANRFYERAEGAEAEVRDVRRSLDELEKSWRRETDRAARAEAEVGRLRIELGEIKLVLESQDLRLHRYHAVREAAAEIAGSWPVTPEMHKRLIDALAPLVPDEQKASSDAPRSGV